jgi:outer membrane receptor protein involved in Fe transport
MNGAGRDIKALDAHAEGSLPLSLGRLRLYGDATYRFHDVHTGLFEADLSVANYFGEPLTWRANAGADWLVGSQTIGVNVQYYGSYQISDAFASASGDTFVETIQGSPTVPAQAYVDLHLSKRFHLREPGLPREVRADVGVINVFDTAPPRVTTFARAGFGYSVYGDPRQRRFQVSLSAAF